MRPLSPSLWVAAPDAHLSPGDVELGIPENGMSVLVLCDSGVQSVHTLIVAQLVKSPHIHVDWDGSSDEEPGESPRWLGGEAWHVEPTAAVDPACSNCCSKAPEGSATQDQFAIAKAIEGNHIPSLFLVIGL